jgi:hypothetical protein
MNGAQIVSNWLKSKEANFFESCEKPFPELRKKYLPKDYNKFPELRKNKQNINRHLFCTFFQRLLSSSSHCLIAKDTDYGTSLEYRLSSHTIHMSSCGPDLLRSPRLIQIWMGAVSMMMIIMVGIAVTTVFVNLDDDDTSRLFKLDETNGYMSNRNDDFRIPNPYPKTFQIQFVTNITSFDGGVRSDTRSTKSHPEYPIEGTLYYDWTRKVQRIDHGPGSYECIRFYQVDSGCILLFRTEGMYRILPPSITSDRHASASDVVDGCCLDLPDVGPPPPNWASQTPSTWKGMVWDDYGQVFASEWWFDRSTEGDGEANRTSLPMGGHVPSSVSSSYVALNDDAVQSPGQNSSFNSGTLDFHTVRQLAFGQYGTDDGLPLVFTFPSLAKGRQDMHFQYHTMDHNLPNDDSLFELPPGCANNPCAVRAAASSLDLIKV